MPPHGVGDLVTIIGRAAAGRVEPLPPGTDPRVVDVLDRMCALDPADRPTAAQLTPGPEGTLVAPGPFGAGPGAFAATSSPPQDVGRSGARRALTAVGALCLLALGVLLGVAAAERFATDGDGDAAAGTLDELVEVAGTATTEPAPT